MKVNLIAAINRANVIGMNGYIPWKNNDDLNNFKRVTHGHVVVMGRNTYDSIGKPLDGRYNLVLTNRPLQWKPNLTTLVQSVDSFFANYFDYDMDVFVIGGASIYSQFAKYVERVYLTIIDDLADSSTAVYFPWEAFEGTKWKTVEQQQWDGATYLVMDKI